MKKYTQRKDGRYQAKVHIGKGKYTYLYDTSVKRLDKKVAELKIKLGKGVDIAAKHDTFGEWAEMWLKNKKATVAYKRWTSYKAGINKFEEIYNTPINKVRTVDVQAVINEQFADGKSKQTLEIYKMACSQVFKLAIANRVTEWNPATAVTIPKGAPQEEKRALTEEEQQWIINTPHRAQTAAMIMMYAGLRCGELIPLLWTDIDLEAKTITVNKSVAVEEGGTVVKDGAKTESGERVVYIPDKLVDYLATVDRKNNLLVCPSAKGKVMSNTSWKRLWESYLGELNRLYGDFSKQIIYVNGVPTQFTLPQSKHNPHKVPFVIPNITAHWLRHTYITMLYLAGVDVMTAKEQAGHADIKTTMQIYTHLDKKYKVKQIDKLNDFLGQKSV